jgi:hypothetical protein
MSEVARHTHRASAPKIGSSAAFQRPDWVMVGAPWPERGGVMILASRSLEQAVLEYSADLDPMYMADYLSLGPLGPPRLVNQTLKVEVYMRPDVDGVAYVMVTAPTYAQALEALLKHWSPDNPTATQVFPRELEQ